MHSHAACKCFTYQIELSCKISSTLQVPYFHDVSIICSAKDAIMMMQSWKFQVHPSAGIYIKKICL